MFIRECPNCIEIAKGHYIDSRLYKYLLEYYSDSEIRAYFEAVRRPPRRYYVRVNTLRASPEEVIERLRRKGLEAYRDEYLEEAIWFPVKGPFKVPSARKIVVADKRASESVYMGADLYAPGVVKFEEGIKKGDEVNVIAPNGEVIAYGIAQMDFEEVERVRRGLAVRVLSSVYQAPKVRGLPEYEEGLIYDQGLPAQWVSRVLNPEPGDAIIDMCAAPGGKTSHIIQLTKCKALVLAFDKSKPRILDLIDTLRRLGMLCCCQVYHADSRYLDLDMPHLIDKADKVLLDPPCTDMGVRPRLFDLKTMAMVEAMSKYQRQFVKVAVRLLRRKGVFVYSTCTLPPLENEDVVKYAMSLGLRLENVELPIASKGVSDIGGLVVRFYPNIQDTPGFFIAKLVKA